MKILTSQKAAYTKATKNDSSSERGYNSVIVKTNLRTDMQPYVRCGIVLLLGGLGGAVHSLLQQSSLVHSHATKISHVLW